MNRMRTKRLVVTVLISLGGLLGVGAVVAIAARAAPSSFQLVFDGRHEADPTSPVGFWHVGPFRASGAFCSSGRGATLRVTGTTPATAEGTRLLTCDDGSGSATVLVLPIDMEHGGSGVWRIVAGTGQYAELRGKGRFASVLVSGDPNEHGTIVFRSTWTGIAELDDEAPAVSISRASATKLRRPNGSYRLRIAFSARDRPENLVRYVINIIGGGVMVATRTGEAAAGTTSVALRIRLAKGVQRVRLQITASDPIGNERMVAQSLKLPA